MPAAQGSGQNLDQMTMEQSSKIQNPRQIIKNILDLDDACLLHLFSLLNPLPDLFNAARSCKVMNNLQLI